MIKDPFPHNPDTIEFLKQEYCYVICGLSILDIYYYLLTKEHEIIFYKDIPSKKTDDWGSSVKFKELLPINQEKLKKLHENDFGITGIDAVFCKKKDSDAYFFNFSQREIVLQSVQLNQIMQGVYACIISHDFDWRAHCYFENDTAFNDLVNYFKQNGRKIVQIKG